MSYSSLEDFYQINQALEQHHKYQTSEIENWIVYERDIKVDMITQYMEHLKQQDDVNKLEK
jgi:hypothetical protein